MDYTEIPKPGLEEMAVKPNLGQRDSLGSAFDWKQIEAELGVENRGEINQAHLCIDRHAASPRRDKVALVWEGKNGETERYTFGELAALTDKFANVLEGLGVAKGDRVFTFVERIPELYIAIFGGLKLGAIVGPLFADFGSDPVRDRLLDSQAKVLVTSPALKARIAAILDDLPELKEVIIIDRSGQYSRQERETIYHEAMADASANFTRNRVGADDSR